VDASCPITWIEPDLTVNADPAAQLRLLDLQAADTALAQLVHRRSTLPELAALADATQRTEVLVIEAAELATRLADVDADQRRLEAEVDNVRARTARDERRLTGGGLPAKELESLQHEITTLARRQSSLEDDVLDMMEQRESLDSELQSVATRRGDLDAEREKLEGARDAAWAEMDEQERRHATDRQAIAAELPADLVQLYDRIRLASGGVGAALLRNRRCEGCRIELAGNELATVRHSAPDVVIRCDNCRRILVRTAESGL
jgi:predicted  nucleic acid-binding Zn-ribbon protein